MYSISDYILLLAKNVPKVDVDFSIPVGDQIDYEDHNKIVDGLYNGITLGYVSFLGRVNDLRSVCDSYVVAAMTYDKRLNPNAKDNVVENNRSDFILDKLIDSLNNTDPESLLFKQIEDAIEKRKSIINSNVSEAD